MQSWPWTVKQGYPYLWTVNEFNVGDIFQVDLRKESGVPQGLVLGHLQLWLEEEENFKVKRNQNGPFLPSQYMFLVLLRII